MMGKQVNKETELTNKINGLKAQLKAERNKNSFTNAILEGGTVIIWAVNTSLELVSFNQNYFNYFLDKSPDAKVRSIDKGKIVTSSAEPFWKGKYKVAMKGRSLNFEVCLTANKINVWKEVYLNPIYDTSGSIIGVSGLAYDITEKMQSKFALMESEQKFRNIFESFQDLYFRCNFNGRIIMLSPSIKEIAGYNEKKLLGKNITNYYLYNSHTKALIRQLVKEHKVRNFETGIVHKSGVIIPCICNIRVIYDENKKPLYIEGVARNIKELKQSNEELQRSKELAERSLIVKERFLANMSHEIRTPLNGIIGMLHLLDETRLDFKQKKHVKALKSSSEILLNILNDLLDLSKIEAGKMELNPTEIRTSDILEKALLLYQQQAKDSGVSLKYKIKRNVPRYLFVDSIKLIQIFANLISNAIKFTPRNGNVLVDISVKKRLKSGEYILHGKINDTGIGISQKDQKKLFSSFTQLDSSNSKAYKGTGLGLYISKQLVRLFKGKIGVTSKLDKGSSFWFTFKAKSIKLLSKQELAPSKVVRLFDIPKVLIVDDNKVNLQLATELLRNAGCKVSTASSGAQAILKARSTKFDLILMDIQMPDMDGIETTKKIRSMTKVNPPIIAMTAYSMKGDRDKFLKAGMDDYIAKPISPAILIEMVVKWTSNEFVPDNPELQLKVLNYDTLSTLEKYGGKEIVIQSLNEFNSESRRQINECLNMSVETDIDEILVILHTLKGNAGTLGVEKIAYFTEMLEDDLKKKKCHNFEGKISELEDIYEEFGVELKHLINKNSKNVQENPIS